MMFVVLGGAPVDQVVEDDHWEVGVWAANCMAPVGGTKRMRALLVLYAMSIAKFGTIEARLVEIELNVPVRWPAVRNVTSSFAFGTKPLMIGTSMRPASVALPETTSLS